MKWLAQRTTMWRALAVLAVLPGLPAQGEIKNISGSATATVVQYSDGVEAQRDFGQEAVPLTTPLPPAVARARLDRLLSGGEITAAGQAVAVLDNPNFASLAPPSDVGLDLGAFTDESGISWFVEGVVRETRTIQFDALELGGDLQSGQVTTVRSRVFLSGVMLVTAEDTAIDLTGVESRLLVRVTKTTPHVMEQGPAAQTLQPDDGALTVLEGEVTLVGGPDGTVEIGRQTGVFADITLSVFDFENFPEELPLVRAILFVGMVLTYEYEVVVDQEFALELFVQSQVTAAPTGAGAAAVFGLPQEGLGSIFDRVKRDDRGWQLAAIVSQQVDTTGESYRNQGSILPTPFPAFFPFCGVMGIEVVGLALLGGCWAFARAGRRRTRWSGGG